MPVDQPTINFAWVDKATVLHEFGHVLGLIEEHQNPRANLAWNKDLIYRELGGPPNHWSKHQIEANIFWTIDAAEIGDYRDFDPKSVMNMIFAAA